MNPDDQPCYYNEHSLYNEHDNSQGLLSGKDMFGVIHSQFTNYKGCRGKYIYIHSPSALLTPKIEPRSFWIQVSSITYSKNVIIGSRLLNCISYLWRRFVTNTKDETPSRSFIMFSLINTLTRVKSSTEAKDVSQSLTSTKLKAKPETDCKWMTRD